jgi:hypothetical protein
VGERAFAPDNLQPGIRPVLPRHRFLARRPQPTRPGDRKASGVAQPPIHATAALRVYEPAKDTPQATAFLQWLLLRLSAWHDYLHRERDPECEGLVYTRHPWESGMDNSPMWDQIMQRLQLRPEQVPAMSAPIPTTWPPKSGP